MDSDAVQRPSPFGPGDYVIYTPSQKGLGVEANTPASERLEPGKRYRVAAVTRGSYVVVEGYRHVGGGLYWTEFTSAGPAAE